MRIFLKVIRWIIIIIATMSILGFVLGALLSSSNQPADAWVALFWAVVGGIALYFELRKPEKD